jgi:excisionase family DNA binding protein
METSLAQDLQEAFALRMSADRKIYDAFTHLAQIIERPSNTVQSSITSDMPIERQYTTQEICRILRCSTSTLWRLRRDGLIGFRRVGNRPMFLESHIEDYQQQRPPRARGVSLNNNGVGKTEDDLM